VAERRAEAAEEPREEQPVSQLLRRRRHPNRLDPVRDEVGPPGRGRDPDSRTGGERAELAEEIEDIRLVAGAVAAEHVRVHDDELRHASSRHTRSTASATAVQE
jgi:hypothetical protein